MTLKQLEDLVKSIRSTELVEDNTEIFISDDYNELFPLNIYDTKIKGLGGQVIIIMKEEF